MTEVQPRSSISEKKPLSNDPSSSHEKSSNDEFLIYLMKEF